MILELDDISKRFGQLKVADAISFGVTEGEALGIVGPNGAGKTTLFSLIGGAYGLTADACAFSARTSRTPRRKRGAPLESRGRIKFPAPSAG